MGKFNVNAACPPGTKRISQILKWVKASNVKIGPAWSAPPDVVAAKFGVGSDWLIGVDIETHDWEDDSRGNKGTYGQFGHYNLCKAKDLESRIVQLGWAFGPAGCAAVVKERLVRPDGFQISEKATDLYKITHEEAEAKGLKRVGAGRCAEGVCR